LVEEYKSIVKILIPGVYNLSNYWHVIGGCRNTVVAAKSIDISIAELNI
jgi:hypothetical protein